MIPTTAPPWNTGLLFVARCLLFVAGDSGKGPKGPEGPEERMGRYLPEEQPT
jgi:hypothetical protein